MSDALDPQALRDVVRELCGHLYASPDQITVCEPCEAALASALIGARSERDAWARLTSSVQAERDAARTENERQVAEIKRLREALTTVTEELDRWGYGDFHYGSTPREPSVLAAVAAARAALSPKEPPPRCPSCDTSLPGPSHPWERCGDPWHAVITPTSPKEPTDGRTYDA